MSKLPSPDPTELSFPIIRKRRSLFCVVPPVSGSWHVRSLAIAVFWASTGVPQKKETAKQASNTTRRCACACIISSLSSGSDFSEFLDEEVGDCGNDRFSVRQPSNNGLMNSSTVAPVWRFSFGPGEDRLLTPTKADR